MVGQRPVKLCVLCMSFAGVVLRAWHAVDLVLLCCLRVMGRAVGGIPIPLAMPTLLLGDFILSCAASEQ